MSDVEEFDALLRSKLLERDFPFDELNWEAAERSIIQQEKRRKISRFALIFSAGIAAGVIIMLPFMINAHNTLNNVSVTKTTNQTVAVQNSSQSPNQSVTQTNNIHNEENAPLPVQPAFVKKDSRTGIRSTSSIVSPIVNVSKEHKSLVVENTDNNTHKSSNPNLVSSDAQTNKESANKASVNVVNANGEVSNVSSPQLADNSSTTVQASSNTPQVATENKPSTAIVKDNNNPGNSATPNVPTSNKNISTDVNGINKTISKVNNDTPTPKKDTTYTTANSPPPQMLPGTKQPKYIRSDISSNILSVYAGGNYSLGWNDNGTKEANGISPWAGLSFTHGFGNILISFGIGYSELTNLNESYTSSIMQYDFGANSNVTTVTPLRVYYIAFPLKLQYSIDAKNMIGVGCDYLLMLTTYSNLTNYQQNYFTENQVSSEKQNGYTQGFSNFDWQFTLSYTRMLTSRLGITAEYYHDMDNIENNTITGINQYAKNNGFRLVFSYQLMK